VILKIFNNKGIKGFYMGLGYTYLKVLPLTGFTFTFNEKIKNILEIKKIKN